MKIDWQSLANEVLAELGDALLSLRAVRGVIATAAVGGLVVWLALEMARPDDSYECVECAQ